MEVLYRSTRGNEESVSASKAILEGLASDGGLFVPQALPSFDKTLDEFAQMDYRQTAYEVMKLLLTDFTEEELRYCIDKAYDGKFDTEAIAPLAEVKNAWYLELFHGPTIAFKDMALSILPYLMTTAAKKNQIKNEIVILTATSGDTGKAALAGFADVPGTRIMVFYPKDGVSPIQEKQMVTQTGANTRVIGIHGNFDDAQSGVKKLFADKELAAWMEERGYQFSSANSINIGRLVPQIVYYVYAYGSLDRIYTDPAAAVKRADAQTGVVLNRAQQYVCERGNKKTKLQMNIEDVPESIRTANWKKKELQDSLGDMGTVIDLTGCTLDNVLYEVSAQRPVIAKTGENSSVVIVGYDEYNTYLYDPATGQISPYGMNDSTALFESAGNVFLTYIENVIE